MHKPISFICGGVTPPDKGKIHSVGGRADGPFVCPWLSFIPLLAHLSTRDDWAS